MKKILTILSFIVLWAAVADSGINGQEGFIPLFNGKNLEGWVNVNCAPETWQIKDGMIVSSGLPYGVLRTEKQYENYVLELEWRHLKKGGNAGLFVHSDPLPAVGKPFTRSIEVQIMDGNAGDVFAIQGASMTPDKPGQSAGMRSFPSANRMNPAGEWNHYRVLCLNGNIMLSVNGEEVTRGYYANPRKGYICLESEGSEVHFRNIRIHELPGSNPPTEVIASADEAFRPLYNGLDLRGWKSDPGHDGHWKPNGFILDYDGKSEADVKDLWSREELGNFILIVDWRLPAPPMIDNVPVVLPNGSVLKDPQGQDVTVAVLDAGDSGVYVRGAIKSQINIWNWPVGSGEIWGYRTDGALPESIRRGATPLFAADNKAGEWNRFVITVIDSQISVQLNGRLVIDRAALPGLPKSGPIALQHHGDPVQFANIYVKELK